jgi:hypothetical protein
MKELIIIKPLNNSCLIEVIDEYDGIVGSDKVENVQKGVLRDYFIVDDHITASAGYKIEDADWHRGVLSKMKGKTVYWQEYADSGSKFTIDGKQYVLVPFYRLIGWEA